MSKKGIIIFDLDGTIVDSMTEQTSIFSSIIMNQYGIPNEYSEKIYKETAGQPLDKQFLQVINAYKKDYIEGQAISRLIDIFWEEIKMREPKLFPFAQEILEVLFDAGYILCLSTGCSLDVTNMKLTKSKIRHYFKLILTTDYNNSGGSRKGRDHINTIIDVLKISLTELKLTSILIGDGVGDIKMAKEFGITSIGIPNTCSKALLLESGATMVLDSIFDVLKLLLVPSAFKDISKINNGG